MENATANCPAPGSVRPPRHTPGSLGAEGGVTVAQPQIEAYLDSMRARGCTEGTVRKYRRDLAVFYDFLPPEKRIRPGTLERWRGSMLEAGYAPRTVNARVSEANSLLEWLGHRELQLPQQLRLDGGVQPELTRAEYLRLLSAARAQGKEQAYLLVKLFAVTGLGVQELPRLTVEAVAAGRLVAQGSGPGQIIRLPAVLREELADYSRRRGLASGPVFVTGRGSSLKRTAVTITIQRLARDARVPPEKCNPRCLRKLYLATMAGIQASVSLLVEQSHERLLEQEQLSVGWGEVRRQ